MKGSRIADEIMADFNREKYFKQKVVRNNCIVDKEKRCDICKYKDNCDEKD